MNVERKWYQIVDGQFTILTDDQKTKPEFDRLTIKNVREEDKGIQFLLFLFLITGTVLHLCYDITELRALERDCML